MAESTIETIRSRNNAVDSAVDDATAGYAPKAAQPPAAPAAPAQPTIVRGTTNPDSRLDQGAFHAVKKFFGVAE